MAPLATQRGSRRHLPDLLNLTPNSWSTSEKLGKRAVVCGAGLGLLCGVLCDLLFRHPKVGDKPWKFGVLRFETTPYYLQVQHPEEKSVEEENSRGNTHGENLQVSCRYSLH